MSRKSANTLPFEFAMLYLQLALQVTTPNAIYPPEKGWRPQEIQTYSELRGFYNEWPQKYGVRERCLQFLPEPVLTANFDIYYAIVEQRY